MIYEMKIGKKKKNYDCKELYETIQMWAEPRGKDTAHQRVSF